ncbi:MAG: hypothetical protein ACFFCX_00475 [Candidatus Sifarchaeia archaeon]
MKILSSTNIEIEHIPNILAPGDNLSFLVHLTDDTNSPIPNATIMVFKDNLSLARGTTNSLGDTQFNIQCNSSWISLGNNEIHIVYEQSLNNFFASSESTFTIEISKIPTFLSIQAPFPYEVILNEPINLYIEISQTNSSLPNELLEVFVDDTFLLLITSNSSGVAHINLNIDERFSLGLNILNIHYKGTERLSESSLEISLLISSSAQIIIKMPQSVDIGSNIEIEITISDMLDRPIPNSLISLFDVTSNQRFTSPTSSIKKTTIFQYELQGPTGIHTLNIEIINNPFIINTSSSITFSAWSSPNISLLECNVNHYASPNQDIIWEIQMTDWAGNCTLKRLQLQINNEPLFSVVTNSNGRVSFSFTAPFIENQYNISISYDGNNSLFESPAMYEYRLLVTRLMPVQLVLDFYEIITPLQELSVHLTLRGFNGSSLEDVHVYFNWLGSTVNIKSMEGGTLVLHLRIPTSSGSYILLYESEMSNSVLSSNGSFIIEITRHDILSLEGVGITGLTIAIIISLAISIVPIIQRKYVIG